MKAYVTSRGEPTTDLCIWALERNGFEVELIYNETSTLAQKLDVIYHRATDTFLRVDADVIVNKNCTPEIVQLNWWTQYMTFDWYKQDRNYGGVQLIGKECLPILREKIKDYQHAERPETEMYRLKEFMHPRRCESLPLILGIHGYGIRDFKHIVKNKIRRQQVDSYDFELADRLNEL